MEVINFPLFSFPRPAVLIYLPYIDIIKVAGVRLPAHLVVCGAVVLVGYPPHFLCLNFAVPHNFSGGLRVFGGCLNQPTQEEGAKIRQAAKDAGKSVQAFILDILRKHIKGPHQFLQRGPYLYSTSVVLVS